MLSYFKICFMMSFDPACYMTKNFFLSGQDFARSGPYGLSALPPHMDPMLHYRLASVYPSGSRERYVFCLFLFLNC